MRQLLILCTCMAPCFAGIDTLACSAIGTNGDAWSLGADSTKVMAVARPDDDATSYIVTSGSKQFQSYTLSASSAPSTAKLDSVVVISRLTRAGASTEKNYLYLGAASTASGINPPPTGSWSTFRNKLARPGGGSWALSDLTSLQVGVYNYSGSAGLKCTTLYVLAYWTPASLGNFFQLFP